MDLKGGEGGGEIGDKAYSHTRGNIFDKMAILKERISETCIRNWEPAKK